MEIWLLHRKSILRCNSSAPQAQKKSEISGNLTIIMTRKTLRSREGGGPRSRMMENMTLGGRGEGLYDEFLKKYYARGEGGRNQ